MNINDIKDVNEANEFVENGLKELERLFSDISNRVNGEWDEYVSDLKKLGGRFAFDHESYISASTTLIVNYHTLNHQEQMKRSDEVLEYSKNNRASIKF